MNQAYRELARRRAGDGWPLFSPAQRAALVIFEDCLDRRGIKWEFAALDPDVLDDIVNAWTAIIEREFDQVEGG